MTWYKTVNRAFSFYSGWIANTSEAQKNKAELNNKVIAQAVCEENTGKLAVFRRKYFAVTSKKQSESVKS